MLKRCQPRRAQTKGKVENGIGYVRKNFWPRVRTFTGLEDLNRLVRHWMESIANVRIHGTTYERPTDRWSVDNLQPIQPLPYQLIERHRRKVSKDCLVSYESSRYSIPYLYAGQLIDILDNQNGTLTFFSESKLIAQHTKAVSKHQVVIQKKHFEGLPMYGSQTVPQPLPRLVSRSSPDVDVRSLSIYDELTEEIV